MILCDASLLSLLTTLIPNDHERDGALINPASIDVRIGRTMLIEVQPTMEQRDEWEAANLNKQPDQWSPRPSGKFVQKILTTTNAYYLKPGQFALVELYESIYVPNGYAVELKLKSSRAREGYNHSLAFWVDPGWNGYLTMEIHNITQYQHLPLTCQLRFAQIIVHQLDHPAFRPYNGRYQNARGVESSKP